MVVAVESDESLLEKARDQASQIWVDFYKTEVSDQTISARKTQIQAVAASLPERLQESFWNGLAKIRDESEKEASRQLREALIRRQHME